MLLRAEFMYGEASEVLVAEHTILGERRRERVRAPQSRLWLASLVCVFADC